MKILQLNTVLNSGSTGRIAEEIGKLLISGGNKSYQAYGRYGNASSSATIKIGNRVDFFYHIALSRIFDRHGFGSKNATYKLIAQIESIQPDLVHLHNVHGYYLNIEILFPFLKSIGKPVVWTFHDCWPFTGHCSHYQFVKCDKWQTQCYQCPNIRAYPKSWLTDHASSNFDKKRELFRGFNDMLLVAPSKWLAGELKKSFLREYDIQVIQNGIDLKAFKPYDKNESSVYFNFKNKHIILGVASVWTDKKGLNDFILLRSKLDSTYMIVLVGLTQKQADRLPSDIFGITRTENKDELARLYSAAELFVNPTYVDNFPTTNLEALACGTPVITYDTGGSAESIDENTGMKIPVGNLDELVTGIQKIITNPGMISAQKCRSRAEKLYNSSDRFTDYLKVYEKMVNGVSNKICS